MAIYYVGGMLYGGKETVTYMFFFFKSFGIFCIDTLYSGLIYFKLKGGRCKNNDMHI